MRNQFITFLSGIIVFVSCAQESKNETPTNGTVTYTLETVAATSEIPWGMDFLPDGSFLFTEKSGNLIHFKNGEKIQIQNVPPVYFSGQGGLLDVAVHPDFDSNNLIYLTLASDEGSGNGGNTALVRAALVNNRLESVEVLYKAVPNTTAGQHFGSRVIFDRNGFVYFSIGDRGNRDENPQDITRDGGKVYRLHDDGRIPSDNPFVNETNAKTATYSYGHRNIQGMALHPATGEIWTHEHGPRGGDEINIIKKGENYGWPLATFGTNYNGTPITENTSLPGMEDPLYQWTPSIAPSGMAFVNSNKYPKWDGELLVGSLVFQYLELVSIEGNTVKNTERLFDGIGRVRDVRQGPDGYIYLAVEGKGILRIVPETEQP
ncbi:PQQ-dependent sugar dehydrogenase [Ascidiimonas aurantiaca]|uniref:PQQ-dependent sugar dehydrogenase n=1 Tax=Ascidiimonas aurantiaca TaxID=1685432 RepID=UPI0030EB7A54